jgi:hypothetical protein
VGGVLKLPMTGLWSGSVVKGVHVFDVSGIQYSCTMLNGPFARWTCPRTGPLWRDCTAFWPKTYFGNAEQFQAATARLPFLTHDKASSQNLFPSTSWVFFMQKIRQLVEKSPYTMTFACAAKHLCCVPTLPIQPNSSDPAHPQHTCCQCNGVMHGVGFGCGNEFDAVHEKLDKTKFSMNAKSIKHITAKTICLLCYTSLVETNGDKLPNTITNTPEEIIIDEESGNRALDGRTPVPVLGGDETLPKKRPNSVAEKLMLKKKQHVDRGESTKHNEFTIQEKLNILEELGAN